jgi:hypothetical protein
MQVPPAQPFSVEALFHDDGAPAFGVNVRSVAPDSALGRYLATAHSMREIGAIDSLAELSQATVNFAPSKAFDTLLFVDESSAAHTFYP